MVMEIRPIRTEADYQNALKEVERLFNITKISEYGI
jgi:antitoxin component HigA of HigAB toxin-antitoxin module